MCDLWLSPFTYKTLYCPKNGFEPVFLPPLETDAAPEAHPNTYFPLRRRCAALVQYPRLGRLARIRDRLCADIENLYKKGFPVEHFSADIGGQICLPSAIRGLNFFLKAPLRGGEALGAIRARKKSANQQKKRVRTRVRTRFSPSPKRIRRPRAIQTPIFP